VLRDYHFRAAEGVLLSIPPRDGNLAHVHGQLGALYAARSASSLADGDMAAARSHRAQAMAALARALSADPQSAPNWNQLALLCLQSGDMQSANPYWLRMVRQMKEQAGLAQVAPVQPESAAVAVPAAAASASASSTPTVPAPVSLSVHAEEYPECSVADLAQLRSSLSVEQLEQAGGLLCNLGVSLQLSDRLSESERAYAHSLLLRPDQPAVYMNKGNLHRQRREYAQSLECFGRALALQPDYALAWSNLALLHVQRSDLLQGHYCMERAHSFAPASQTVQSNRLKLAILLRRLGFVTPLPPAPEHFDPLASTPMPAASPLLSPTAAMHSSGTVTAAASQIATRSGVSIVRSVPVVGGGGGAAGVGGGSKPRRKRAHRSAHEDEDDGEDEEETESNFDELMDEYVITK
jgi:tetratricopeptide (TPR) repeat protein